jgi:hypothetical protein
MLVRKKELTEALRVGVKTLVFQEVRMLRLERDQTPHFVIEAMTDSIKETRKTIAQLTKGMEGRAKALLLRRMIRQAVDEEIDHAVELRKARCLRCTHMRFYDETGTAHVRLPAGSHVTWSVSRITIGCDQVRPDLRKKCVRFEETARAALIDDCLNEVTLLYEVREILSRINEIWRTA